MEDQLKDTIVVRFEIIMTRPANSGPFTTALAFWIYGYKELSSVDVFTIVSTNTFCTWHTSVSTS